MTLSSHMTCTVLLLLLSGCMQSVSQSDRDLVRTCVRAIQKNGFVGGHVEWLINEAELDTQDLVFTSRFRQAATGLESLITTIPNGKELTQIREDLRSLARIQATRNEVCFQFISAAYRLDKAVHHTSLLPIDSLMTVTMRLLNQTDSLDAAWEANRLSFNRLAPLVDVRDTLQVCSITSEYVVKEWFYILSPETANMLLREKSGRLTHASTRPK
jgi:hypothetical protein